ncbi:ISAs1 family transposase [Streptomyces sp. LN590]|uniref:ISAs1 family transposase n=1 Tax=Streptomyces sp. LN590 TaxID=3112980 RepID=UPI00371B5441
MSLLHHDARREAFADASRFRGEFYECLTARRDELFELTDALLCVEGPVVSPVDLTLVPEHRRGHGAMYGALNHGRIDVERLRTLLAGIDDTDLAEVVVTADALHAQRDHAAYLRERGARYMLTIKNNQRGQARQLHALPWKEIPVIHRDDARGHGRHEQRLVQVVTVGGQLFPHAAQVLRIQRRRRLYGAKKWSSETIYATTDLPAEEANAVEIASWARGHWTVENAVHGRRDVTFN